MKKQQKGIFGLVCSLGMIFAMTVSGGISASATSVGDVIAHARAVGMPEDQVQMYINMYSGGDYTSEQCDQAIAALDSMAGQWQSAVDEAINAGTTTASENSSSQTTTTAKGETTASTTGETLTDAEIVQLPLQDKIDYINSLPEKERTEFMENMSTEVRNSFLKQMDSSQQLEIVSSMLDVGDAFGLNFSVDSISDGSLAISARDAEGNLVGVTTVGNSVESTGIPYTVPVLVGSGAILLALGGLAVTLIRSGKKERNE